MSKKFYIFLIIMLVASLVTSISYIIINYKKDNEQKEIFEELEEIRIENKESDEKFISKAICLAYESNDFLSFYRLNNDIIITLKSYDYAALENIAEKITNFQD